MLCDNQMQTVQQVKVGASVHGYRLYFVRKNSETFDQNKRHGDRSHTKILTITIIYIYLCLMFFTVYCVQYFDFISQPQTLLCHKKYFLGGLILLRTYSNSYANALIYLYNMQRRTGGGKTNPARILRLTKAKFTSKVLIMQFSKYL